MSMLRANLLLLFSAIFWGAGNVAQKSVLEDLGPLTTVGLRCLVGAMVVAPLLLREHGDGPISRRGWHHVLIAAGLFTAAVGSQQFAFSGTSVSNGSSSRSWSFLKIGSNFGTKNTTRTCKTMKPTTARNTGSVSLLGIRR